METAAETMSGAAEEAEKTVVNILGAKSDDPVVLILCLGVVVLIVLTIILILLVIVLHTRVSEQRDRVDDFLMGRDGISLEKAFAEKFHRISEIEARDEALGDTLKDIYRKLHSTYQKTGLVKYDAYSESGGHFSFALTLLDERNNGFLLNVMNGREGGYSFIKEITAGEPEAALGMEEEQSLKMALAKKPGKKREKNAGH